MLKREEQAERIELRIVIMLYAYYALSSLCALYLHAHPMITGLVIVALIPIFGIYLTPERYMTRFLKSCVQYGLFGLAGFIMLWRYKTGAYVDLMIIEFMSICGVAIILLVRAMDFNLVVLIGVIQMTYGSLRPMTNENYILLPASIILLLLILYARRSANISRIITVGSDRLFKRTSIYAVLHVLLILGLVPVFYSVYPQKKTYERRGLVNVSFEHKDNSWAPPKIKDWVKDPKVKPSKDTQTISQKVEPVELADDAKQIANTKEPDEFSIPGKGDGSGVGKDLVMHVKSPVKLYWLGQLYDHYDGKTWRQTMALKKHNFRMSAESMRHEVTIDVAMVKWISPRLFGPYISRYEVRSINEVSIRTLVQSYSCKVLSNLEEIPTPYYYKTHSYLNPLETLPPAPKGWVSPPIVPPSTGQKPKTTSKANSETRVKPFTGKNSKRRKQKHRRREKAEPYHAGHALQLPDDAISQRVKDLAAEVIKGKRSDLERGRALRDFLRSNYTYQMFSKKIPEGKETVDTFLFDYKEGHCEYFAMSLVVMARSVGIPARIATGFSPGDYNMSTKMFDVYEYHAHAWTQLYIEGAGWLTFDPTPPSSLTPDNFIEKLKHLNDPFGDEWEADPPELAASVTQYIQRQDHDMDELSDLTRGSEQDGDLREKMGVIELFVSVLKENIQLIIAQFKERWMLLVQAMTKERVGYGILVLSLLCVAGVGIYFIVDNIRLWRRYRRFVFFLKQAEDQKTKRPDRAVNLCYRSVQGLLSLSGFRKENSEDLLNFASSLRGTDRHLSKNVLAVFFTYSQRTYSERPLGVKEVAMTCLRSYDILELLEPYLKKRLWFYASFADDS